MSSIHDFCVYLVLFLKLFGTHGDICVPGQVRNLYIIYPSRSLTWTPPLKHCNASNYLVTIKKEGNPNFLYYVQSTVLDLSFLPTCQSYVFSVLAIAADHVQGAETLLYAKSPGLSLNLNVGYLNITQNNRDLLLAWSMEAGMEKCVDLFRIVMWAEDTTIPTDIYVQNTRLVVPWAIPCMKYEFEIRAIFDAEREGEPLYSNYTATSIASTPPTLANIDAGVTTVNITWDLQSYSINHCPITSLIADASPYFNVSFPIEDSSSRPPFVMKLSDLTPSSIYLCRIYVVNSAGTSTPLAIAMQTQPGD